MNKVQIFLSLIIVSCIGTAIFLYGKGKWWMKGNNTNSSTPPASTPPGNTAPAPKPIATGNGTSTSTALDYNKTLYKGMPKNNEVKELQRILGISADGLFGNQTLASVKSAYGKESITLNEAGKKASAPYGAIGPEMPQEEGILDSIFNIFK